MNTARQNLPPLTTPNDIRVTSWSELNDVIFDEPFHPKLDRYRSNYVYRGVSDCAYDLKTSLMRLGGDFAKLEPHVIRGFQKYAHLEMNEEAYIWNWLSLAQHHGLPTRLLDWTYSPMVALHFVTDHTYRYDCDGAIWCINILETNKSLAKPLKSKLEETDARVFTTGMMHEKVQTLADFDALSADPSLVFFEPPSLDARIVNQYSLFSMMSDPTVPMDRWLPKNSRAYRRIIVPAELKWEIRDKLDQSNINERVLFPGLDGLCGYLKRYYSPKTS